MKKIALGFTALILTVVFQASAWACPMSEGAHKGDAVQDPASEQTTVSHS